jgi:hypothetical protein
LGRPRWGIHQVGLPTVRALDMARFSGFRASSPLQMDPLDLFARSFVTHLHLFEPCTVHFRRRRSVNGLCLAHGFPRWVRLSGRCSERRLGPVHCAEICGEKRGPARSFVGQSLRQRKSHGDCDADANQATSSSSRPIIVWPMIRHGDGSTRATTMRSPLVLRGLPRVTTNCPLTQYQRPRP